MFCSKVKDFLLFVVFVESISTRTGQAQKYTWPRMESNQDVWNTSPIPCELSYVVSLIRVCDISELSLVPY